MFLETLQQLSTEKQACLELITKLFEILSEKLLFYLQKALATSISILMILVAYSGLEFYGKINN